MLNTRSSLLPLDKLIVPIDEHGRARTLHVVTVDDGGVHAVWFTPNGVGPFKIYLPHADLVHALYIPESAGQSKSHFKMSAQEIVDTDKHLRKVLKLKDERPNRD